MTEDIVGASLLLLVGIEAICARVSRGKRRGYTLRDSWGSLGVFAGFVLLRPVSIGMSLPIFYRLHEAAPFKMPEAPWVIVVAVLVWDFFYYFFHRVTHEVNWFWAAHEAHHSSTHFNLSTGLRQAWWTPFSSIPFFAPMALIGFSAHTIVAAAAINLLYQILIHTEFVGRLGPLEYVLNTPSHHRVHHAADLPYVGRNLGGTLIVWDFCFGTFAREVQPPSYGLIKNIETHNPIRIGLHAYFGILGELWRAKGFRSRWAVLAARPIGAMRRARW